MSTNVLLFVSRGLKRLQNLNNAILTKKFNGLLVVSQNDMVSYCVPPIEKVNLMLVLLNRWSLFKDLQFFRKVEIVPFQIVAITPFYQNLVMKY